MTINALSLTQDETIKEELIALLLEWHAGDKNLAQAFSDQLSTITAQTDAIADAVQTKPLREQTKLADEIGKQAAMEKIKQHIATL